MLGTPIARVRTIGLLEGLSFLLLLFVAMPLKYALGMPEAVRIVGMAHGVLFIAFVGVLGEATLSLGWSWRRAAAGMIAAVLPFGTFVFDARLRRESGGGAPAGGMA